MTLVGLEKRVLCVGRFSFFPHQKSSTESSHCENYRTHVLWAVVSLSTVHPWIGVCPQDAHTLLDNLWSCCCSFVANFLAETHKIQGAGLEQSTHFNRKLKSRIPTRDWSPVNSHLHRDSLHASFNPWGKNHRYRRYANSGVISCSGWPHTYVEIVFAPSDRFWDGLMVVVPSTILLTCTNILFCGILKNSCRFSLTLGPCTPFSQRKSKSTRLSWPLLPFFEQCLRYKQTLSVIQ
jgi:hypothetical protein